MYRPSRELVGSVRLIFPTREAVPCLPLLALLDPCAQAELRRYPLDHMAEISRYVISKGFRRRNGEDEFPDVGYSSLEAENSRRLMPHLTLGLMRATLHLGASRQVHYFCASMRPAPTTEAIWVGIQTDWSASGLSWVPAALYCVNRRSALGAEDAPSGVVQCHRPRVRILGEVPHALNGRSPARSRPQNCHY